MVRRNVRLLEVPRPEEDPKILRRPLPQILDEVDGVIQAVADATRKADEAARMAKESNKAAKIAVEESVPRETVIVIREISREEAKTEIVRLFKEGKVLYYSDIARKLRLDLELVVNICEELQKQGEVAIDAGVS